MSRSYTAGVSLGWLFGRMRRRHGKHHRRHHTPPPPPPCQDGLLYAVGPGDSLAALAVRFRLTRAELAAANPQVESWGQLLPGQLICVPAGAPFQVCLPLRPTGRAAPEAAGVLLARRDSGVGVQLLLAATGLPEPTGACIARFERDGQVYLSVPLTGGLAAVREPGGALVRFDRVAVESDGLTLLEGWGRDCLPAPPASPLGPF